MVIGDGERIIGGDNVLDCGWSCCCWSSESQNPGFNIIFGTNSTLSKSWPCFLTDSYML